MPRGLVVSCTDLAGRLRDTWCAPSPARRARHGAIDRSGPHPRLLHARRNRLIGFVFQSFNLLPRLTAWENVALPLLYAGMPRAMRKPSALQMLEKVGLADRAEHRPGALSGGQQQRVALARALIRNPGLVLADEPTGSLDSVTAAEVMELLRELNRSLGATVVMVTHDRDLASRCDRRIEMLDGRIVADVTTQ